MNNILICNGISTHKDSPISLNILNNQSAQLLKNIESKNCHRNYIVLGKTNESSKNTLEAELKNYPNLNLEIIMADENFSFVYHNESAILKAIVHENPIQRNKDKNEVVFTVEELLNIEEKTVYIHGKVSKNEVLSFPRTVTPRKILEKIQVNGQFKAMYFAYPMGIFVNESALDTEIELKTDRQLKPLDYIFHQQPFVQICYLRLSLWQGKTSRAKRQPRCKEQRKIYE